VSALNAERPAESFGLVAIRQRIEQLGGTLTIESKPGSGTAIAVTLPLPAGTIGEEEQ
jgi:signal transduction histidine kinase